jgi:hypothetical protein
VGDLGTKNVCDVALENGRHWGQGTLYPLGTC